MSRTGIRPSVNINEFLLMDLIADRILYHNKISFKSYFLNAIF